MKEKKKSAVSWILTWAGQKRIAYVWSVLLAIGNVIFKILPYFIIADVVKLFLNGEKEFKTYLAKAVLIALSFIIAELLHSLSTALSHKATFAVLANIRKFCCDKLARVPLGYVKDTSSGTFKNIMVERIDSIETTLAHIVPEFTSNLLAPVVILIYFFLTDWRLALWSLVPVIVGLFSYFGMMLDYKPSSLCLTKGICLQLETGANLGTLKADKLLLERAIMNVISNALDYSPPQGTIYVTVQKTDCFLHISITDEGGGFTPEALHHAQEQFFMGDKSRTSNMHFGMGLYITSSIIKQHGGQLVLSNSKKTGGAQVIIKIPY